MAKQLNKSRMLVSRAAISAIITAIIFTRIFYSDGSSLFDVLDMIGVTLVGLCAMGRLYCTVFLGGHKNKDLVIEGPYSVVRNPLYLFSVMGVIGLSLMSHVWPMMIGLPFLFIWLYKDVVSREEAFLNETFGKRYEDYCANVPRFVPQFSLYIAPEMISVAPKQIWHGFRDSCVWFLPYILFVLGDYIGSVINL